MDESCQNQTKLQAFYTDLYQLKTFSTRKKEVQVFVMVKEVFVMLLKNLEWTLSGLFLSYQIMSGQALWLAGL
jgi:hypothetical protein